LRSGIIDNKDSVEKTEPRRDHFFRKGKEPRPHFWQRPPREPEIKGDPGEKVGWGLSDEGQQEHIQRIRKKIQKSNLEGKLRGNLRRTASFVEKKFQTNKTPQLRAPHREGERKQQKT